jgi:hypothetical protein
MEKESRAGSGSSFIAVAGKEGEEGMRQMNSDVGSTHEKQVVPDDPFYCFHPLIEETSVSAVSKLAPLPPHSVRCLLQSTLSEGKDLQVSGQGVCVQDYLRPRARHTPWGSKQVDFRSSR